MVRPLTPQERSINVTMMRLTVNLEPELYAMAKSLAQAEDCSMSAAINRLLHRAIPSNGGHPSRIEASVRRRNGIAISAGRAPITSEMVGQLEDQDGAR